MVNISLYMNHVYTLGCYWCHWSWVLHCHVQVTERYF